MVIVGLSSSWKSALTASSTIQSTLNASSRMFMTCMIISASRRTSARKLSSELSASNDKSCRRVWNGSASTAAVQHPRHFCQMSYTLLNDGRDFSFGCVNHPSSRPESNTSSLSRKDVNTSRLAHALIKWASNSCVFTTTTDSASIAASCARDVLTSPIASARFFLSSASRPFIVGILPSNSSTDRSWPSNISQFSPSSHSECRW